MFLTFARDAGQCVMDSQLELGLMANRRQFFGRSATGIGSLALGSLLGSGAGAADFPSFAPRAKRVIYLFQSGAPSQMDLLDYKASLQKLHGQELPSSIRQGQRLTGMTAGQKSFAVADAKYGFQRCGKSGLHLSTKLPYTGAVVDDLCIVNSMFTEAINHDPAITFIQTGHQQPGRPSIGAWFSYGLGAESENLPAFVVLLSKNTNPIAQPIYDRLWGSGFLPSNHQGVKFRSQGDPVLYLNDPAKSAAADRRRFLDHLAKMNRLQHQEVGDPEILSRISQYEMAYRMQTSVPELTDLSDEPASTFALYGEDARIPGTHAANCLLARRLAERGVRFIQLFHRGWDHHFNVPKNLPIQCRETDQGSAALVADLKRLGMLDDTLVVWGGEFGRTVYSQGSLTPTKYGRDHHPRCFSIWLAGGGVQGGIRYGKTDDFCYNIAENPVHVHDMNATIMHLMGIDHERLTYRYQGRDYRLTDVHGHVVNGILA
ncbi:MAG: hypothetical protein ACI8W8_004438 [Rhodothermales bacterium]|jgi:hypothetical protein